MKRLLLLMMAVVAIGFTSCSNDDDNDSDNDRDVVKVIMTLDVPEARNGEEVDISENSWVDGFIDDSRTDNIVTCNPSKFVSGISPMTLTIKRHRATTESYCMLFMEKGRMFFAYDYPSNKVEVLTALYEGSLSTISIYLKEVEIVAQSIKKIDINRFGEIDKLEKVIVNECPSLEVFKCKSHPTLTILDLSDNPNLTEIDCTNNPNLTEIWLKTGINVTTIDKDEHTVIKYK